MKTAITTILMALAAAQLHAQAAAPTGQPAAQDTTNANRSIWTLDVTKFRKEHSLHGGYTKTWDLSGLPHYQPKRQLTGTLRIWGSNYLKDGPIGEYWRAAFKKFQPGITIEYNLPTAGIAIPALAAKDADLGVGRPATLMDYLTFQQVYKFSPTEVMVATGSYDVYGWSPAYVIVVNKDNPLRRISMKQLDGVFGSARNGGYDGSVWRTDYPYRRGPDENVRTWGQLGLTGEWANKPIHACGQSAHANIMNVFSDKVLAGSDQWVEGYAAYANYAKPDGTIAQWTNQVRQKVESDPLALCIVAPNGLSDGMHELAVQGFKGGPYVQRTLETVRDRSYPLINEIFFYAINGPGHPIDPKAEEFLRFVLSQEGQAEIEHEGRYLPLTAEVVKEQLAKLATVQTQ
jgi:phosphate transport system substrate-binding protein